jgi:ureidoacrylate peracid hydrolase
MMSRSLAEKVDPRQAALIVVDVLNDFCHPEGAAGLQKLDLSMVPGMVEHLNRFIGEARRVGLPIIFVRTHHSSWTDSEAWLGRARTAPREQVPVCVEGTWGCEWYEVFPEESDRIVTKHRFSAFIGTDLDQVLRARGIRTLLIGGIGTSVCVESTARVGYQLDYEIVLLEDCCAAYTHAVHDRTVRNIAAHFGDVVREEEVTTAWAAAAQR